MKMKTACIMFCLADSLMLNATYANTITIYGLNAPIPNVGHHKPGTNYRLQLASFHSKRSADQFSNRIASITTTNVHVQKSKKLADFYQVYLGPMDVATLNQTRQQLSSKQFVVNPRSHKTTFDQQHYAPVEPVKKQAIQTSVSQQNKSVAVSTASARWKDMPPCNTFSAGPYVGASIGLRENITGSPTVYRGFEGTISAGIGHLWNQKWYLAGEAFGADNALIKNYRASGTNNSISSTLSYGADLLPGFMITDHVLLYGRGGFVQSRFNDMDVSKNAWRVGLGGQTTIYNSLDLRAEYIYSLYQTIPSIGRPQGSQVNVGLVKKFG